MKLKSDIDHDIWQLLKGFNPDKNVVDQKLLYMITGRGRDKHGGVVEADYIYSEGVDEENNILTHSGKSNKSRKSSWSRNSKIMSPSRQKTMPVFKNS